MSSISMRPQVLVGHADFPKVAVDLLKTKCDVTILDVPKSRVEVLKIISKYDAALGFFKIDTEFLNAAGSRLKVVSTISVGCDHLDVAEMKKRGIKVGNVPYAPSMAVAELAIYLLLGAIRRTQEGRILIDQGKVSFRFMYMLGHDLRNKTVGIVGLGKIGVEIVKRLKPFEISKFVYTGHSRKSIGDEIGAEFVSLDELLKQSDFIICTVPMTEETRNMFNDELFEKMKKTAVFVNIGRGQTVNTDALVRALKSNKIFAAGLDVTEPEPLPIDHELLKLPNVLITPHMGSQTVETRNDMAIVAVQNILNGLEGKPLLYEV